MMQSKVENTEKKISLKRSDLPLFRSFRDNLIVKMVQEKDFPVTTKTLVFVFEAIFQ